MEKEFVEAINRAISCLIADFQGQPGRFWNERDMHWYLFHHLKQDPVFQCDYGTELIRAEFPTRRVHTEDAKPARGHYDLVILDPTSVTSPPVSQLPPWASWEEYLPHVVVLVAIEVKTWVDRTTNVPEKVDWDGVFFEVGRKDITMYVIEAKKGEARRSNKAKNDLLDSLQKAGICRGHRIQPVVKCTGFAYAKIRITDVLES